MLRLISIVLLVAGLLAAGLGTAALLESAVPRKAAMLEDDSSGLAATEGAMEVAAPAAESPSIDGEAVPEMAPGAAASHDLGNAARSAQQVTTDDYTFQPMMEAIEEPAMPAFDSDGAVTASSDPPPAAAVDARPVFLDTLRTAPIAHETPREAEYKRPFDVTFAIDATGDDTAVDAMPGRGVIESGEARVSDQVEVRLSGASFDIRPSSPPVQTLSPLTENTWRWSVTPLTAGNHDLVFEVFAMDEATTVPLRTFRDTVTVKVSGLNRAIAFADQANPLFVLLGGLGSALAGLLGAIRFFGKK